MGWDGSPLFKGDSQSASCIIMRSDISIHTKLFLSPGTFVLPTEAEYLRPLSRDDTFSHTPLLLICSYPKHPHNTPVSPPSLLSTLEYPVFHLAARRCCVNVPCQLCNIISWVVASCLLPLHNLPATVRHSMRVLLLCLFWGTNMIP